MQLIKITSTPIEYEIKIEKASLQMPVDQPAQHTETTPSRLNVQKTQTQLRIDSSQLRYNLNMKTNLQYATDNAEIGKQNVSQVMNEYVNMGKQLSQIQNGTKVSDYYRQKMLSDVANIPTIVEKQAGDPEIQWQIGEVNTSFSQASVKHEWQISKNKMEYVPGRFHMDIIQLPKVSIEYVGEPIYIPKSSAPNAE